MTPTTRPQITRDASVELEPRPAARRDVWIAVAATTVALLPVLMTVLAHAGRTFLPGGDIAIIDLRVRDVFSTDLPLTGPYSRYGWNHPGPAMFYALSPLNALAGGAAWATLVGGALLQGVATALSARLAWRRGGVYLTVLVMTAISLAATVVGERLFIVPWNPYIAFPFFALFVLQIWSVGLGDRWRLLGATIVGTFLVQTHVGYAPLVAAGAASAVVFVVVDHRRTRESFGGWTRPLLWSIVAALVLWLPPIVQQLTGTPGNLSELAHFVRRGGGVGLRVGAGVLAGEFHLVPPWLGGSEPRAPFTDAIEPSSLWWLLIPICLLVGGLVVAHRAGPRARDCLRLLTLLGVLSVVGFVAIARVEPPLDSYLFLWRTLIATLLVAAVMYTVVVAVKADTSRVGGLVAIGALGLLLAWAAGSVAWDVTDPPTAPNPFAAETRALLRQLRDKVPEQAFIVRNVASARRGVSSALVDELERRDAPVRVDDDERAAFGKHRAIARDDASAVWFVAEEGRDVSLLTELHGAQVVARTTPLGRADEAELVRLQRALARRLEDLGRADLVSVIEYSSLVHVLDNVPGIDRADVDRVAKLTTRAERRGQCRCAVIAFRPHDAPPLGAASAAGT